MFDISKLSVMTREHSFNTIHQILNCFTNCFYLLFSFCLYCSLCRYLLGQLLVSWVKPFRAANRMFETSALKITEIFLYLYPEIKFTCCVDSTAKCLAADSINCSHIPSEGIDNTNWEQQTRVRSPCSDCELLHVLLCPLLTTLCRRRSSRSDTELLNCDAKEHICWQRLRSSNSAASRFRASAVLVRKPSKWMILLQRKVTWKSKQEGKNYSTSTVY